jgi:hypothetical protein
VGDINVFDSKISLILISIGKSKQTIHSQVIRTLFSKNKTTVDEIEITANRISILFNK